MATSGSTNYTVNRDDIITEALEQLGVLGEGESPNSDQLTSSARTLNMMVKSWQSKVKNLHVIQDLFVFQNGVKETYIIDGTTDHASSEITTTALGAAAASSATTLNVDSITGFSNGDNIGIELDDGTRQWTTINGAPSGTTITLTDALTGAAAIDNTVVGYTTKADTPYRVDKAYRRNIGTPTEPIDVPIKLLARGDYVELTTKKASGPPTQVYVDKQRASVRLKVWPLASSVNDIVGLKVWRTLEDFDAATDDADFPSNWYLALSYNLALYLAPKYGLDHNTKVLLKNEADDLFADASSDETEEYMRFEPTFDGNNW